MLAGLIGFVAFAAFIGKRGNLLESRDYFYYFFQTIVGLLAGLVIYGAASGSKQHARCSAMG